MKSQTEYHATFQINLQNKLDVVDHLIFEIGITGKETGRTKRKKLPDLQLCRGALTDTSHTG